MPLGSTSRPFADGRLEQYAGVHSVIVIARRQRRASGPKLGRRVFAVKIGGVGDEAALLEQILAAGDVFEPGPALLPPSAGAVEVRAPLAHRHAGPAVGPGLHGVAVEDEAIDTLAEDLVAKGFEGVGIFEPAPVLWAGRGSEGFGADNLPPINVADRRGELHRGTGRAADPELAHRDVGRLTALERLKRPGVRLERGHQPMLVAKLLEMAVVVLREQIRDQSGARPTGTAARPPGSPRPSRRSSAGRVAGHSRGASGIQPGPAASSSGRRLRSCQ